MNPELTESIKVLTVTVVIVSIETIGIMQWLKNFMSSEGSKRKRNALVALMVLIPCAILNSIVVPYLITTIFNVVFLSLAVEQLAYQTVVKGIPKIMDSLFDRAAYFASKKAE